MNNDNEKTLWIKMVLNTKSFSYEHDPARDIYYNISLQYHKVMPRIFSVFPLQSPSPVSPNDLLMRILFNPFRLLLAVLWTDIALKKFWI